MITWLLVHSPLLGPRSWAPVAVELTALGDVAKVPDLRPALGTGPPFAAEQARLAAAAAAPGPLVLVAHSGAGPLLPAVAAALADRAIPVAAGVFVDAGLPQPGRTRRSTLPTGLAAHLDALAVDTWLPPWPRWWEPEDLAGLLPDPDARTALSVNCPPLPVALFDEQLPPGPDLAGGYLRLSAAYDDEARAAAERGWPVSQLDADHLAPLTRPREVARALRALAVRIGEPIRIVDDQ